jgi:hypothetical protein
MRQVKWCLLLLAAISPGCQPEAATARRQAATNDRSAEEAAAPGLAGTADRPVAAGQAEAAPAARPAEGTGSRAQGGASGGGPPGNGASAPVAEPAAAGEGQDGKAAAPGLAGDEVKKDAIQTADDAAAALLLLDDEPLALADDSGESPAAAADNSRCHHCHLNYIDEELAVVHARAKIGCADCHGNCDAHIADESWASGGNGTAPGVMYTKEKINPFCLDCHPREKIDTLDKTQHKALFAGTSTEKYCTDCHGDHRLTDRKCKWK